MIVKKTEYHRVNSEFIYDLDDEDIIDEFGSLEAFEEACAEETDEFWEFVNNHDYDREDDWWTDRKGGYEVEWEIVEDGE